MRLKGTAFTLGFQTTSKRRDNHMARHIKAVIGSVRDGDTETDGSETISKKIYDVVNGASQVHSINITKYGILICAIIDYETA